jgi:hypothetical protein
MYLPERPLLRPVRSCHQLSTVHYYNRIYYCPLLIAAGSPPQGNSPWRHDPHALLRTSTAVMTNCPRLLLRMLCDSVLSAVLDTDKQSNTHACIVAWPLHAMACVEGGGMACLRACKTTNNHCHRCMYCTGMGMLQHHRFISNAYILDSVKGKDARRRVSCMTEHVRQGSICGCLLTSILDA